MSLSRREAERLTPSATRSQGSALRLMVDHVVLSVLTPEGKHRADPGDEPRKNILPTEGQEVPLGPMAARAGEAPRAAAALLQHHPSAGTGDGRPLCSSGTQVPQAHWAQGSAAGWELIIQLTVALVTGPIWTSAGPQVGVL